MWDDQCLLIAKIWIPFNKSRYKIDNNTYDSKIEQGKYNLSGLNESSIRLLFQNRLNEKLNKQYLTTETTILYRHIMESLHAAAHEALGNENKYPNIRNDTIPWNTELENQKNKKQQAYIKWLNTKDINNHMLYRQEQVTFKNIKDRNRNKTWGKKCKDINNHIGGTKLSEAWKLIKLRKEQRKEKKSS